VTRGESQQQRVPKPQGAQRQAPCRSPVLPILPAKDAVAVLPAPWQFLGRSLACCAWNPTSAAVMTAGMATRASLTVPGQPDQVHAARVFVGHALGAGHPCTALAVLLVSELVTNSVLHSDSRLPGRAITVTVAGTPAVARVEVRDAGGTSAPVLKDADNELTEGGRGLRLVNDLAARWNYRRDPDGLVTWFEVCAEPSS
jgi:anti-sigma regulatory factor (Ser/Thr protein kinase)